MDSRDGEAFNRIVRNGVLQGESFEKEALLQATGDLVSTGSESADWCEEYRSFTRGVRVLCSKTQSTVNRYARISSVDEGFKKLTPSVKSLDDVMKYSHKLAYSSFAPPHFVMGDPLGAFKPPTPQAQQFLASKLHDFAEQYIKQKRIKTEKSMTETELVSEKLVSEKSVSNTTPEVSSSSKSSFPEAEEEEEEVSVESAETKGLKIELDMSTVEQTMEIEKTDEAINEAGFGFVLNPDLELSEDNSPVSSSIENSSSEED